MYGQYSNLWYDLQTLNFDSLNIEEVSLHAPCFPALFTSEQHAAVTVFLAVLRKADLSHCSQSRGNLYVDGGNTCKKFYIKGDIGGQQIHTNSPGPCLTPHMSKWPGLHYFLSIVWPQWRKMSEIQSPVCKDNQVSLQPAFLACTISKPSQMSFLVSMPRRPLCALETHLIQLLHYYWIILYLTHTHTHTHTNTHANTHENFFTQHCLFLPCQLQMT